MAKIGTAIIEIKPVLNDEAMDALCKRIEESVAAAVERALHPMQTVVNYYQPGDESPAQAAAVAIAQHMELMRKTRI